MLSILWSKKTRAILSFLSDMDLMLKSQYPNHKQYTKEQISWLLLTEFPKFIQFAEYAFFIYLQQNEFNKINNALGKVYLRDEIHQEIIHVLNEVKDKSALAKYSSISSTTSMRL